ELLNTLKKRIQQTLGHLIQQNHFRLQGILKHPLFVHPYSLIEWRMQKLDDYRPQLELSMHQFINLKKHQLAAKALQANSLKPINLISHFRQRFSTCERSLEQYFTQKILQDRQKLIYKQQQLDHLWDSQQ